MAFLVGIIMVMVNNIARSLGAESRFLTRDVVGVEKDNENLPLHNSSDNTSKHGILYTIAFRRGPTLLCLNEFVESITIHHCNDPRSAYYH